MFTSKVRYWKYCLALVGGCWLAGGNAAQAQGFGNVPWTRASGKLMVNVQSNGINRPVTARQVVNMKTALNQDLQANSQLFVAAMKKSLGKSRRWGGQTMYNIDIALGNNTEMQISGNQFKFIVHFNMLRGKMTTPSGPLGIGLGSYADPAFKVGFDLIITGDIAASNRGVTLTRTNVSFQAAIPTGTNVSGTVLRLTSDLVHWMGGPDCAKEMGQALSRDGGKIPLPALKRALASLTPFMQRLPRDYQMTPAGSATGDMTFGFYKLIAVQGSQIK